MADIEKLFKEFYVYEFDDNGRMIGFNEGAYEKADEAFAIFQMMYDTRYGSINIDDNLVDIHTGGWSDNEELISVFKKTAWWSMYHRVTATGGHYYFNTGSVKERSWKVVKQ